MAKILMLVLKGLTHFMNELTNVNVAVVSVKGMVCDFCARGIAKTFLKDKSVKKIDVDLGKWESSNCLLKIKKY